MILRIYLLPDTSDYYYGAENIYAIFHEKNLITTDV